MSHLQYKIDTIFQSVQNVLLSDPLSPSPKWTRKNDLNIITTKHAISVIKRTLLRTK